jgi:hypothetical protein
VILAAEVRADGQEQHADGHRESRVLDRSLAVFGDEGAAGAVGVLVKCDHQGRGDPV